MNKSKSINSQQVLNYIDTISIITTDLGGANTKIIDCNNGSLKIFGYEKEELIGQKVSILHLSDEVKNFSSSQNKLSENNKGFRGETILVRKGGIKFPALLTVHPFFDDDGTLIGTIGTAQDITKTKIAENELQEYREHLEELVKKRTEELESQTASVEESKKALTFLLEDVNEAREDLKNTNDQLINVNQELEAFAYSVSHDLRAPLRHIHGFIDLLNKAVSQSDLKKVDDYSKVISKSAHKMGILIDDLLSFSRIGRNKLKKQPFDVNEVIQDILNEYASTLNDRKIVFDIAKISEVTADRNLIRVVLSNLIGNAIKFTRNRKNAKISIGELITENTEKIIFVKDNGAGFNNKYVQKLFGVFQRLHTEDEFEGTGVGLATAQRIIHKHGGKIWAEGKVDNGATFYIKI